MGKKEKGKKKKKLVKKKVARAPLTSFSVGEEREGEIVYSEKGEEREEKKREKRKRTLYQLQSPEEKKKKKKKKEIAPTRGWGQKKTKRKKKNSSLPNLEGEKVPDYIPPCRKGKGGRKKAKGEEGSFYLRDLDGERRGGTL